MSSIITTYSMNCKQFILQLIDHGKTTLMDKLLGHCGSKFSGERAMDSKNQEERYPNIQGYTTRFV